MRQIFIYWREVSEKGLRSRVQTKYGRCYRITANLRNLVVLQKTKALHLLFVSLIRGTKQVSKKVS